MSKGCIVLCGTSFFHVQAENEEVILQENLTAVFVEYCGLFFQTASTIIKST